MVPFTESQEAARLTCFDSLEHMIGVEAFHTSQLQPNETSKTNCDVDIVEDDAAAAQMTNDETDSEDESDSASCAGQPAVSDLIEIQGLCHIDLLGAHFKITHNEETNDFFVDLVQSDGCLQSVLQVIFRFPLDCNGLMQIFASSYDRWTKPGRVIVHSNVKRNTCSSKCKQSWRQNHWHLQLHVYEHFYTIELNGRLIDTFEHRMAFRKVRKQSAPSDDNNVAANCLPFHRSPAEDMDDAIEWDS